jgi:hypothetical protein
VVEERVVRVRRKRFRIIVRYTRIAIVLTGKCSVP